VPLQSIRGRLYLARAMQNTLQIGLHAGSACKFAAQT
jgi:hypothetical protein